MKFGGRLRSGAVDTVAPIMFAVIVGLLTNLVTGDHPAVWLFAVFAAAVLAHIAHALRQARIRARTALLSRERVLPRLRGLPEPPAPGEGADSLASLMEWLSAAHCPAPLWGRSAELRKLIRWCEEENGDDWISIVAGFEGAGKKRLAVELAKKLSLDWYCGRVVDAAGLVEAIDECGEPCLVVVTDTDLRRDLAELINSLDSARVRVRLLLCVRDPERLRRSVDLLDAARSAVSRAPVIQLGPVGQVSDRLRWFEEAVRAFSAAWKMPPPSEAFVPVGDVHDAIVVLLCRAMLTVLDRPGALAVRSMPVTELMDALWSIQVDGWVEEADSRLPASVRGERAIGEIVAARALDPAAPPLAQLRRFTTTSSDVLAGIHDWVCEKFPAETSGGAYAVPRLLLGHLILTTLEKQRELALAVSRDSKSSETLASTLAWAVTSYPDRQSTVVDVVRGHSFASVMIRVLVAEALPTSGLDSALADLIRVPADPDVLDVPVPASFPHTRCAQLAALIHEIRKSGSPDTDLADALVELARIHTDLGHVLSAVRVSGEAVVCYRRLAKEDPAEFEPLLADALCRLVIRTRLLGDLKKALRSARRTVALCRRLVEESDRHVALLANALHASADCRFAAGDPHGALRDAREGVALRRVAVAANPDGERPGLGWDLIGLGIRLFSVGAHDEALMVSEDTVTLYGELAAEDAVSYRMSLAWSLTNLALSLLAVGRPADALVASRAAIRTGEGADPGTDIELGLSNLANSYYVLGMAVRLAAHPASEAIIPAKRALALRRELMKSNPDRHAPDLARDLCLVGRLHVELGSAELGMKLIRDGVARYRRLAAANAGRYRSDLSEGLLNVAVCARGDEAAAAAAEAAAIDQELLDHNVGVHAPRLAQRMFSVAATRLRSRDRAGAIAALDESLKVLRPRIGNDPGLPVAACYLRTAALLQRIKLTPDILRHENGLQAALGDR